MNYWWTGKSSIILGEKKKKKAVFTVTQPTLSKHTLTVNFFSTFSKKNIYIENENC